MPMIVTQGPRATHGGVSELMAVGSPDGLGLTPDEEEKGFQALLVGSGVALVAQVLKAKKAAWWGALAAGVFLVR